MFGSTILEIIVILVFVFLIYSLLTTILVEIISSILRLRARNLRYSILRMLQDSDSEDQKEWPAIKKAFYSLGIFLWPYRNERGLVKLFFNRPSIKYLGQDKANKTPSYLEASVFSKTLLDILQKENGINDLDRIKNALGYSELFDTGFSIEKRDWELFQEKFKSTNKEEQEALLEEWLHDFRQVKAIEKIEFTEQEFKEQFQKMEDMNPPDKLKSLKKWKEKLNKPLYIEPETRLHLCSLLKDSGEDITQFRLLLEDWFDQTMARSIGWYKKKISYLTFFIGLFVAIGFNVDTVHITKELKEKTAERNKLMVQIEGYHKLNNDTQEVNELYDDVQTNAGFINQSLSLEDYPNYDESPWSSIFGWLLTAIAISFGAPFWFDLLNKLMQLRSSIKLKPSDDKKNDAPKSGKKSGASLSKIGKSRVG